jgi:hypothetical protein
LSEEKRVKEAVDELGTNLVNWLPLCFTDSPGIVVDEALAKATPCRCYDIDGKLMCFSKGIIGTLDQAQIDLYCKEKQIVKEGIAKRVAKFREAAEVCKARIKDIPKGERLKPWLECMSKELRARGITL